MISGGSINLNFKPDEFSPELASSLYVGMHSQQNFKKTNSVFTAAALLKSAAAMQRKGTQTTIFLKKLQILATNFHYLAL